MPNPQTKTAQAKSPEEHAESLLDELSCDQFPVPVDKLAKQLGAQLRYSPLDEELSGMIFIRNGVPIIGINSLHHLNRQRFTIAHEIGHLRMHPDQITAAVHVDKGFQVPVLFRDAKSAEGTERWEIEANQFAAALLMPRKHLAQALATVAGDIEDQAPIEQMARKFRVSVATLNYRIRSLHPDIWRSAFPATQ